MYKSHLKNDTNEHELLLHQIRTRCVLLLLLAQTYRVAKPSSQDEPIVLRGQKISKLARFRDDFVVLCLGYTGSILGTVSHFPRHKAPGSLCP